MTGSIAAVVFLTLIACLVLTVPIGFSLGIASLGYILYTKQLTFGFIAQNMVTGCDSFPTMAIPFFIFAGELMGGGGISKRLLNLANVFFGRIQGGLAIVTVVVCMFFAAISGSGPATVAAVGGMVIPTMLEKGYDKKFVLALIAAAGSIGVIIPPSIPMVIYAVTTNSSVSTLFLAGFVPGILIGLVLIAYSYFYAKKMGYKGDDEPFSVKRALRETKEGFWAILSPVIILGGIYGGIFTPTEAAAVSVIYSIIVGCVIYRELDLKKLIQCTKNACETTASILIVIGCAAGFSKVLTLGRIPTTVASAMMSLTDSKIVILLLINVLLLIVGCFMETLCAIMILAPILYPVVSAMGVDVTHFGIIMVVNLAIGFITPPLGVNLFVASRVGETTLDTVIKGIIPFLILMICVFPLTRVIVGTTVGTKATIVPLVVAAFPFVARLVETSLRELDEGVVEAAQSMGATPLQIITKVMIPECLPGLISSMTTALTTILGYSAMSGVIGGGGLGKIALSYGYYRYQTNIMVVCVILLVLLVQAFQTVGTLWATKSDKRLRK